MEYRINAVMAANDVEAIEQAIASCDGNIPTEALLELHDDVGACAVG